MDPVQDLLETVGSAQVDGTPRAAPSSSANASTRRTKMVFVYSDEDEDADAQKTATATDKTTSTAHGVAEVVCDTHAIPLSDDALAELRADAHAIDARLNDLQASADAEDEANAESDLARMGGLFFQEDLLSGIGAAASAPGLTASLLTGGMRVREVDAPRLWDGAFAASNTHGSSGGGTGGHAGTGGSEEPEMPALLRRGLPAATFVLESRRKRFRDAEGKAEVSPKVSGEAAAQAVAGPSAAGEPAALASLPAEDAVEDDSAEEVEVVEELDVQPVYEADGKTVRALQTRGGYRLTLDERDLLEGADDEGEEVGNDAAEQGEPEAAVDEEEEEGEGEEELSVGNGGAEGEPMVREHGDGEGDVNTKEEEDDDRNIEALLAEPAPAEDWGDFLDDEDDDDDEEEEEIDEAIVVAVVEQLVRCCEADDLDPQMSVEAGRFTATAKPLLEQLTAETITPKEFGQKVDRDLRRFQRIYRSVYRPRDSPIVIDGVLMDM